MEGGYTKHYLAAKDLKRPAGMGKTVPVWDLLYPKETVKPAEPAEPQPDLPATE